MQKHKAKITMEEETSKTYVTEGLSAKIERAVVKILRNILIIVCIESVLILF